VAGSIPASVSNHSEALQIIFRVWLSLGDWLGTGKAATGPQICRRIHSQGLSQTQTRDHFQGPARVSQPAKLICFTYQDLQGLSQPEAWDILKGFSQA
jgi:hypothetical protein